MTREAWRIVKSRFATRAFDGEGARVNGGRWNSPGIAAVYVSETQALAALEMLVHLNSSQLLLGYVTVPASFDTSMVETLDPASLPDDWREYPAPSELKRLGDDWLVEGRSAVLEIPSAIVPRESNYLLNVAHPEFDDVVIGEQEAFRFDPRLK